MNDSTRCSVTAGDSPAHHWLNPSLYPSGNMPGLVAFEASVRCLASIACCFCLVTSESESAVAMVASRLVSILVASRPFRLPPWGRRKRCRLMRRAPGVRSSEGVILKS